MDIGGHFLAQCFYKDNKSGYLNAAAGTACAGAYKHQQNEYSLAGLGPQVEVHSGKTCGGNNGGNLERDMGQCIKDIAIQAECFNGDDGDGSGDDAHVVSYFFHPESLFKIMKN